VQPKIDYYVLTITVNLSKTPLEALFSVFRCHEHTGRTSLAPVATRDDVEFRSASLRTLINYQHDSRWNTRPHRLH
jgi:hypothetical protein